MTTGARLASRTWLSKLASAAALWGLRAGSSHPHPAPGCAGKCYDNQHNLVHTGCFDNPAATANVVSYYPSSHGFVLSAGLKVRRARPPTLFAVSLRADRPLRGSRKGGRPRAQGPGRSPPCFPRHTPDPPHRTAWPHTISWAVWYFTRPPPPLLLLRSGPPGL